LIIQRCYQNSESYADVLCWICTCEKWFNHHFGCLLLTTLWCINKNCWQAPIKN